MFRTLTDYEKVSEIYQIDGGYETWASPSAASQGTEWYEIETERRCAKHRKKYVSVANMVFHTKIVG